MSLKFWLGGARSDKSNKMLEYVVGEAKKHPDMQYLVVAPDQFGLSAQRQLVMLSDNKGILNIDVLSFMRLVHRISDEVGYAKAGVTVLDDMGKSLLLQLLADGHKKELSVFADNVDKLGYISKIKSIISEFMQYGIKPEKVDEMIELAQGKGKGVLAGKLRDVSILYKEFVKYISDKYTTTEETLDMVASLIHNSDTIRNSVIIFDGFTGFTPVQLKLISTLMDFSKGIHVSLLLDKKQEEIFDMSRQTINQLERMAVAKNINICDAYISQNEMPAPELFMFSGQNPESEVRVVADNINELIMKEGYRYRDIAIITGDIEGYRSVTERVFDRAGIPFFIDKTEPILLNPFIEFIRSLIDVFSDNYSYNSMFRFLKSGFTSIDSEDIDRLENYCLATGIKGKKQWHSRFIKPTQLVRDEEILRMEELRAKIISDTDKFAEDIWGEKSENISSGKKATVREFAVSLYNRIVEADIEKKLKEMSEQFADAGNTVLAEEYKQIYVRVMNVLDELVMLIPDEKVDIKTFGSLVDAGFDGIRIGVAPQSMDYVQVGDLTRSRIGKVKAVFIIGANDGIIPKSASGGGIINEAERQFLIESDENLVLAPTAREEVLTQRLYIYNAINKPDIRLYVSYAKVDLSGKSLMPSYIVRNIRKDYDKKGYTKLIEKGNDYYSEKFAYSRLARLLSMVEGGKLTDEEWNNLEELLQYFVHSDEYKVRTRKLADYIISENRISENDKIGQAVAKAIYGSELVGSVTRLEMYANCAYQYFLKYGMKLKEREQYSFEARDIGVIFHEALSLYSNLLNKKGYTWTGISENESEQLMEEAVKTVIMQSDTAIYSTSRNQYMEKRILRIMNRTAKVLSEQLKSGEFTPKYFEIGFTQLNSDESTNIALSSEESMRLIGRIDRIDTCEKDEGVYVKVIDYKSSQKEMDLSSVYEGSQLQLIVYLNAAVENERNKGKNAIPAGVFYYHIDDPVIEINGKTSEADVSDEIMKKLRLSGLVNEDDGGKSINLIDMHLDTSSKVISVTRTQKGFRSSKQIITGEDFKVLSEYVSCKIAEIGRNILAGNIEVPVPDGNNRLSEPDCKYCSFKAVCCNGGSSSCEKGTEDNDETESDSGKKDNSQIIEMMKGKLLQ